MALEGGGSLPQVEQELTVIHRILGALPHALSHDLSGPLRSIASLIQIVQEDYAARLGEEGSSMLKVACDGCQRLDERVTAMLSLSHALRRPLDIETVDMRAVALKAWDEIISNHQARTRVALTLAALPECRGDVTLLGDVWRHLLDNAIKYSAGHPQPQVWISGSVQRGECGYQIADNGVGFDMQQAPKLFGLFQRLHKAEDFGGAGMGLAIVRSIVERHGGRTAAHAVPGGGARFEFTLSGMPNDLV